MLGFQAAPRLFSGQADEQFCLRSSEYEMSTCVIYCTNSHSQLVYWRLMRPGTAPFSFIPVLPDKL